MTPETPPNPVAIEPLAKAKDVQAFLQMTRGAVRRAIAKENLPHIKFNCRVYRFNLADVKAWADSRKKGGAQ